MQIIQTPLEKLRKIRQDALHLLHQTMCSVCERFVRKTSATTRAIQAALLHYQGPESVQNPVQVRQCNSGDVPQSEGQGTLQSPSVGDSGLVSNPGDHINSRTSPRPGQHNSRLGVQGKSRLK